MISLDLMKSSEVRISGDQPNRVYIPRCYLSISITIFYSLNQSILLHLLSKFLAFLAFIAFKGLKRPKKAEKKTFAKWLRIVQFGEKSNKKNFPSQIFFDLCDLGAWSSSTLVAFFWEKSGFWGSRKLVLKKVWAMILCFFLSRSLNLLRTYYYTYIYIHI